MKDEIAKMKIEYEERRATKIENTFKKVQGRRPSTNGRNA
jgi:hypothetical protein